MPYVPFHEYFPEIAEREIRSFTVLEDSADLPAGSYGLVELYCDEPGCDCRRVIFTVISSAAGNTEAVISYGWESLEFYAEWSSIPDPKTIKEMVGVALNPLAPQSDLAPAILEMVRDVVLQDEAYVERLKSHYRMFKERIDSKSGPKRTAGKKGRKRKRTAELKKARRKQSRKSRRKR